MNNPPKQEGAAARRGLTLMMWMALATAFLGWMFDGMEMGLFSVAIRPALAELTGKATPEELSPYISMTVSLFLIGMACGGMLFGRLGDRLGRTKTLALTVLMYAVFTGLAALSRNWPQLAACRFLGALGLGGEWGLGVALVMETWPNVSRPLLAGLLGSAANFGFLASGLIGRLQAHYDWTWRIVLGFGFAPGLLTFLIRLCVKEPERWVRSRERGESSAFADLFRPPLRRRTLVGAGLGAVSVLGMWGAYQTWIQAWVIDLVKPGDPKAAIATTTIACALGSIVGAMLGGLIGGWLGRRRSFALLCVATMAMMALLYLTCDTYGPRFLWLIALTGVPTTAFFGWLPLYLPELFPTRLRTTGEGFTFNVGRVVSGLGVFGTAGFVNLLDGSIPHASFVMSMVYLVGLGLIWLGPELKGTELPD